MSFLQDNIQGVLAGRITGKGRQKIAQGNFNIAYFQVGDSEFDYAFSEFNGLGGNLTQKVLMPFDKDSQVKYPYKISNSLLTGTTYGTPVQSSYPLTIGNYMGAAGYVSGTTVLCNYGEINMSELDGSSTITVPNGLIFSGGTIPSGTTYITITISELGAGNRITSSAMSFVYKILNVNGNILTLDRPTPDLTGWPPTTITVIRNDYNTLPITPEDIQDSWTLSTVWSNPPAGVTSLKYSGDTSNIFVSAKEYFGYNNLSGHTYNTLTGVSYNTGTTITNSFGVPIPVSPEEQHSLSIIHYSKSFTESSDFDEIFKYDDYIENSVDGSDYFEVRIPFLQYDRVSGTIGATFVMDTNDYYINSTAADTKISQMKFRYLLDAYGNRVGKVFVNHKVIIFDDQEIVAALDYKSNRRYTLPIPSISLAPTDSKCGPNSTMVDPLLNGVGDTVYVTYSLQYNITGSTHYALSGYTGMHCNYYSKITGTTVTGDVSIRLSGFTYMTNTDPETAGIPTSGYVANKLKILVQKVPSGTQPESTGWKAIDFTSQIPNHNTNMIDPVNLNGSSFIITLDDYENNSSSYVLESSTNGTAFGDIQPFTGAVRVLRATDLEVMNYFINLPSGYFEETQNRTYISGKDKRITEVTLLDANKDVLVIAKTPTPIKRVGSQVLAVQIDI